MSASALTSAGQTAPKMRRTSHVSSAWLRPQRLAGGECPIEAIATSRNRRMWPAIRRPPAGPTVRRTRNEHRVPVANAVDTRMNGDRRPPRYTRGQDSVRAAMVGSHQTAKGPHVRLAASPADRRSSSRRAKDDDPDARDFCRSLSARGRSRGRSRCKLAARA
jgi:hypothetical protein